MTPQYFSEEEEREVEKAILKSLPICKSILLATLINFGTENMHAEAIKLANLSLSNCEFSKQGLAPLAVAMLAHQLLFMDISDAVAFNKHKNNTKPTNLH